jgi:hypothetical protein
VSNLLLLNIYGRFIFRIRYSNQEQPEASILGVGSDGRIVGQIVSHFTGPREKFTPHLKGPVHLI